MKNNAADIEDFEFEDVISNISKDEEDSISLGFDDPDLLEREDNNKINRSMEYDPNADTAIKPPREDYRLFEGGGYGKGKPLNNSFSGPYNNMEHIHVDRGANTQFD